jgi:hypothetical protein
MGQSEAHHAYNISFKKNSHDSSWVLGGYPPGTMGKGEQQRQALKKTTLKKNLHRFLCFHQRS